MWNISHHRRYCSGLSTVQPPHPCGLSCGAAPLGRRSAPGLCNGSPVIGCFHGSGRRLSWSPMQPGRARTSGLGVPLLPLARWVGWVAPACPTHGLLVLSCPSAALRVCGFLGHLAPVHRCARSVRCFAFAESWATWLLFTGVPGWFVAFLVRFPVPLGSCSWVRPLGVLCCVWGVLGHLAPVHRSVCLMCCFVCAASWAIWLLFTGVPSRGVPSLCCPRCLCVRAVLAQVAPVHWRARCVRCACAVGGCVSLPPPLFFFSVPYRFFLKKQIKQFFFKKILQRRGRAYTAGRSMGNWCSGAIVSCSLACVVGGLATAPGGFGSRILMYTGMGQGWFG